MLHRIAIAAVTVATASAAQAQDVGDASAGEQLFNQCQTCHVVVDDEGNTIAGRNARTGPNLYGVIGRQAGTVEDFRYGDAMVEAGEQGLVWDAETFVQYVQDPTGFLREYLDDSRARGKMSFRVRSEEDAQNLYAYLASVGPDGGEGDGEEDSGS
ncbi:c-type cytochrome [Tranquillimonas rosea]|uniref:c-type cytochrome n=1 Tax=Tranquillimonas rosea TaxID=641238 RepID=UPI003BAD4489